MKKLEHAYSSLFKDADGKEKRPAGFICLDKGFSRQEALAALNIAGRLAYESICFTPDILSFSQSGRREPGVIFRRDGALDAGYSSISFEDGSVVLSSRDGDVLPAARYFYSRMPYLWHVGEGQPLLSGLGSPVSSIVFTQDGLIDLLCCDGPVAETGGLCCVRRISENGAVRPNPSFCPEACAAPAGEPAFSLAPRRADLSSLFSLGGIFSDPVGDRMNNRTDFVFELAGELDSDRLSAAAAIVSRAALDGLSVPFDFVCEKAPEGAGVIRLVPGDGESRITSEEGAVSVVLGRDSLSLGRFIAAQYPMADSGKTLPLAEVIRHLEKSIEGKTAPGQLALARLMGGGEQVFIEDLSGIAEEIDGMAVRCRKEDREIFCQKATLPWEAEEFFSLAKGQIESACEGDKLVIRGVLSEPEGVLRDLEGRLCAIAQGRGVSLSCQVLCSYKQGLSWLREEVIPRVRHLKGAVRSARLHFKPAPYKGIADWGEYEGDFPPFNIEDKNWQEVPIRLLTEIYPIDDFLQTELDISRSSVTFHPAKQSCDYALELFGAGEKLLARYTYDVATCRRVFLPEYPDLGEAIISCGRIAVEKNGEQVLCQDIDTDIMRLWDFYLERTLPAARDFILKNTGGSVEKARQPFFKELVFEAEASEPDEVLPYRTDVVSSLEALHEDVYFVGLDYFKYLGEKHSGESTDEPGVVSPVLRPRSGLPPRICARLTAEKYGVPTLLRGGREVEISGRAGSLTCAFLGSRGGRGLVSLACSSQDGFEVLRQYAGLVEAGCVQNFMSRLCFDIEITSPGGERAVFEANPEPIADKGTFEAGMISLSGIVGYEQYVGMMEKLAAVEGVSSYPASYSYQGRAVYAFENIDRTGCPMLSLQKLINRYPTALFSCRHHANEVSSTSMAFMLLKDALSGGRYKALLDKINFILLPFENVDGGALHYKLQQDNPQWMLHSARFNALGIDFGREYGNYDTRHTEALAMTRLFDLWLPDMMADNHGIPHHECNYPMTGYTKPVWKANWLPRALWYGYLYYGVGDQYESNNLSVTAVRNITAEAINADPEIKALNDEWGDRYRKYAYNFMPELFEAQFFKDIIYYHYTFGTQHGVPAARFLAQQHPEICAMGWITEVADETAQGAYLDLCARAHLTAAAATLRLLASADASCQNLDIESGARVTLSRKRHRPLALRYGEK